MKKKCVFIVGSESSGSTLIAKIISRALNGKNEWNGRGFNCCNSPRCDSGNDFTLPCNEVRHLVCHRSLPFMLDAKWPPIEKWQSMYDAHFIICTRDTTISKLSVLDRFKRDIETILEHQNKAKGMLGNILKSGSKSFIWSYETFMFLQEDYFHELCGFLGLERKDFPTVIKDANIKYIDDSALKTG